MEKLESCSASLVGMWSDTATVENCLGGPQKYPKELKTGTQKQIFAHPYSKQHYSQQARGGSNSSTQQGINTMWYTHSMEYYSVFKRKEILTHATIMLLWQCKSNHGFAMLNFAVWYCNTFLINMAMLYIILMHILTLCFFANDLLLAVYIYLRLGIWC